MCSAGFFYGFFGLLQEIHRPEKMRSIPKEKPIYIFGGDLDPVGRNGDGIRRLAELYDRLGLKEVSVKLYPGGRHEMLNEVNRDEVMSDVLGWLESHMPLAASPAK
ncbi:hypothetical protein D3C74_342070 [compost metagenome]